MQIPETQGVSGTRGQRRRDRLPNGAALGRAAAGGNHVQTCVAGMCDRRAQGGTGQIGRNRPGAGKTGFKITVGQNIRARPRHAARDKFDVIHIDVARRLQIYVEQGTRGGAGCGDIHPLQRRGCVGGHRRPITNTPVVLMRVNQLQRSAGSAGIRRPGQLIFIFYLGHRHIAGSVQRERLAIRRQSAAERVKHRIGRAVSLGEGRAIRRQNQIVGRPDERTVRERVGQSLKLPARQIKCHIGGAVVQFHKLRVVDRRSVHDLVDDHLAGGG